MLSCFAKKWILTVLFPLFDAHVEGESDQVAGRRHVDEIL